jgi:hypothetical protein
VDMIRRVLSVDPGKLSGVCVLELDTETNTLKVGRLGKDKLCIII